MGFLRILGAGAKHPRLFGQILLAKICVDQISTSGDGVLRKSHAVGSHIGDQADGLAIDLDPFIEPLGDPHGLGCAKPQLARSLLLQG